MEKEQINILIDKKIAALPYYVRSYVEYQRADDRVKPNTLLSYVYDYKTFFTWIIETGYFNGAITDIPISILDNFKRSDITIFQSYLLNDTNMSKRSSRNRMITSLNSLFYFLEQISEDENGNPLLHKNIMRKVEVSSAKISPRDQAARLQGRVFESSTEVDEFLNFVEFEYEEYITNTIENIRSKSLAIYYYKLNKERDLLLFSLILGSGLRVNEVMMLNKEDIILKSRGCLVERKGKEEKTFVNFSNRTLDNLKVYLSIRDEKYGVNSDDKSLKPLFIAPANGNGQIGRWKKRAIQDTVYKYTSCFGKKVSVHNLRHSFATIHWQKNKDVFGLQSQLGHSSPQTTQKYALIFDKSLQKQIDNMD